MWFPASLLVLDSLLLPPTAQTGHTETNIFKPQFRVRYTLTEHSWAPSRIQILSLARVWTKREIRALTCFQVVRPARSVWDCHLPYFSREEPVKTSRMPICENPWGLCMPAPVEPHHPDPGPLHWAGTRDTASLSTLVNSTSSHLDPSPLATEVPLTPDTATQHVRAQVSPHGQKRARWSLNL